MTALEERAGTLDGAAARFDAAVEQVEALDEPARRAALELKDAVERFHHAALVAIVKALRADPRGKEILFELVDDPSVFAVLALQGIVRPPLAAQAETALAAVRPYLASHGGDVELVEVAGAVARVRLKGSCNGCSMSAVTLQESVEAALVGGVDGVESVEVVEDQPTAAFIPLGSIGRKDGHLTGEGWVPGPPAADVPAEGMVRFDVGEDSFVVTNVANRLAAFRNECAHQGMSLDGGLVDDGMLVCPWHGFRYDAATGECLSAPGAQLQQVPLRVEGGVVHVRAG